MRSPGSASEFFVHFFAGELAQRTISSDAIDDFKGYTYSVLYNRELRPGTYVAVSYRYSQLDDTASFKAPELNAEASFAATGNAVSLAAGQAIGLGERADLFGEIGLGYSSSEIKGSATVDGVEEATYSDSGSSTVVLGNLGIRLSLDDQKRIELIPSFYSASGDDGTTNRIDLSLAAAFQENVQLTLGAGIDLDDDESLLRAGLRLFF